MSIDRAHTLSGVGFQRESRAETLWRDAVFAVRTLPKAPGFALGVIVTLALAIGANTAAFSVVNGLLLRSLPVSEAHRLVTVSSGASPSQAWSYAIWKAIVERAEKFDGVCAWSMQRFRVGQDPASPRVDGMFVSGAFFSTLGVSPALGRTFTVADDVRGGGVEGPVAIISYGFWQQPSHLGSKKRGRHDPDDRQWNILNSSTSRYRSVRSRFFAESRLFSTLEWRCGSRSFCGSNEASPSKRPQRRCGRPSRKSARRRCRRTFRSFSRPF